MSSKTEYWDQLPELVSESKREASHGALFAPGLSLLTFSRDTLFCLYNEVSYPARTAPCAMAEDTVRQECDERAGEYRENEAGEDHDPLHVIAEYFADDLGLRHSGVGAKAFHNPCC